MWWLKAKKTQILIEFLDRTQKSPASRQKKFPNRQKKFSSGFEDFVHVFGKLTTPYVMFAIKKTQILIEFLDRTQKSFLIAKKSFLVAKKKFP